jgi:hypothetical protein
MEPGSLKDRQKTARWGMVGVCSNSGTGVCKFLFNEIFHRDITGFESCWKYLPECHHPSVPTGSHCPYIPFGSTGCPLRAGEVVTFRRMIVRKQAGMGKSVVAEQCLPPGNFP